MFQSRVCYIFLFTCRGVCVDVYNCFPTGPNPPPQNCGAGSTTAHIAGSESQCWRPIHHNATHRANVPSRGYAYFIQYISLSVQLPAERTRPTDTASTTHRHCRPKTSSRRRRHGNRPPPALATATPASPDKRGRNQLSGGGGGVSTPPPSHHQRDATSAISSSSPSSELYRTITSAT